jgi:peptidoglycan/LPS O-acetylase OafA/YrhL
LRAVAVLMVLAYHFDLHLRGGFLGVDLFFAISGFVITRTLFVSLASPATNREILRDFCVRRTWRLLPALLTTVVITTVCSIVFSTGSIGRSIGAAFAALSGLANWWTGSLPPQRSLHALSHTWSLAIEEQFYLALPLVLIGLRNHAKRAAFAFSALLIVISTLSMFTSSLTPDGINATYFSSFARATPIALGVLLATILHVGGKRGSTNAVTSRPTILLGGLTLSLAPSLLFADYNSKWLYRGGFLLTSLVLTGIVAVVIQMDGSDTPIARALRSKPAQFIGERSYALYLVHFPIALRFGSLGRPIALALKMVLTAIATEALHQLVEKRFRHSGPRSHARLALRVQMGLVSAGIFLAFLVGVGR